MRESDRFPNDTVCLKDLLLLKCVSEITASGVLERRVGSFFSLKQALTMKFFSLHWSLFDSSSPQRFIVSLPTSTSGPDRIGAVRHQQPAQVRRPEHQPDAPQNQQNQQGEFNKLTTTHPLTLLDRTDLFSCPLDEEFVAKLFLLKMNDQIFITSALRPEPLRTKWMFHFEL